MNYNKTNGQTFAVGQTVQVSGHGWGGAKGTIKSLHSLSFQALVLRSGGRSPVWVPLTALTIAEPPAQAAA